MNKTVTINLGGMIFNIEENAYERLKTYLEEIKNHLSKDDDTKEISEDIEASAAEKFADCLSKSKQVIDLADVDSFIQNMGDVSDITGSENNSKTEDRQERDKVVKKLYRDPDNAMLGGISAGIATYFGIDPVFIRLAFVLATFFGGSGIVAYIILWLIVPEAKTATEKMEMRGEPVTLSGLQDAVKKNFKKAELKKGTLAEILSAPIKLLGNILNLGISAIQKLFPIISIIVGILAGLAAIAGIGFALFGLGNLAFNANSPYIDFPISSLLSQKEYLITFSSLLLATMLPLFGILLVAISFIRRQISFGWITAVSMIMIWMFSLVSLSIITVRVMPRYENLTQEAISNPETRIINLSNFNELDIFAMTNMEIAQGDSYSVSITGSPSDIDEFTFTQEEYKLSITRDGKNKVCIFCRRSAGTPKIKITLPEINKISSRGYNNVILLGFKQNSLQADIDGLSRFRFTGELEKIKISGSGNAEIVLAGKATEAQFLLEGISLLDASEMTITNCTIRTENHAQANILVSGILDHFTADKSVIRYKGEPQLKDGKKSIINSQSIQNGVESKPQALPTEDTGLIKIN
jgi:phage shock protein PspC (stress-responsive transcriptional regulator)